MKLFRWAALPALTTAILLPAFSAAAIPVEPDYPCYIQTTAGQVVNLTGLCTGKAVSLPTPNQAAPLQASAPQATKPSSSYRRLGDDGQVLLVGTEFQGLRNGVWAMAGKLQNKTGKLIYPILVVLKTSDGETKRVVIDQLTLQPEEVGSFDTKFYQNQKPQQIGLVSVEWLKADGSKGQYP